MKRKRSGKIFTLDIETDSNGELVDIGFYDGERIKYFQDWGKFVDHLDELSDYSLIYAHNGGGFDYVNMLAYLFRNGVKFEAMLKQSKIFCFWLLDKPHIRFNDSYNIFVSPLDKVAKSFSEIEKIEIDESNYSDMRSFKQRERDLYYRYLERDCVALYQAIIKFKSLVNEIYDIGDLPLSIGGISMRLFIKKFLSEKIITPSLTEKNFTFKAYVGGRCEYLGFGQRDESGYYHNVNGYDFNSHYPAQMIALDFPIRRGVYVSDFVRGRKGKILSGVYTAKFDQRNGRIPLLQTVDGEYDFCGYGVYTHLELNEIERLGGKIECSGGYYYSETAPIFEDFVKYFYEKKAEAVSNNDTARTIVYKWILNNLYGKFGQRDTVESLIVLNNDEAADTLRKGHEINEFYRLDDYNAFYDIKSEKQCYTSFPAIACFITANARIVLNRFLEACENPLYCDTDSIHCQDEIPSKFIGDDLGQLKIEFLNCSARYAGKKSYEIVDKKFVQKGIPSKEVDKKFFDKLFVNGFVEAEFKRPLLLKSAIRKIETQSPSEFVKFSRTVTLDKPLSEKFNDRNN